MVVCNGTADCLDGSDELNCPRNKAGNVRHTLLYLYCPLLVYHLAHTHVSAPHALVPLAPCSPPDGVAVLLLLYSRWYLNFQVTSILGIWGASLMPTWYSCTAALPTWKHGRCSYYSIYLKGKVANAYLFSIIISVGNGYSCPPIRLHFLCIASISFKISE